MNQINSPAATVTDESQLNSAAGDANVDAMSLTDLNQMLGRQYPDVPTALAAIKETYSFVGKKVDTVVADKPAPASPHNTDNLATKDEVKKLTEDLFYSQNPQYQEHRDLIGKLGSNPAEVVGSAEFKNLFEKAQSAGAGQSVVHSNARLSQPSTKVDEALKVANAPGVGSHNLASMLAQGILEEYGIEE